MSYRRSGGRKPHAPGNEPLVWEWQDSYRWTKYDDKAANQLEEAYVAYTTGDGPAIVSLNKGYFDGQEYEAFLDQMRQTNQKTGHQRQIRRSGPKIPTKAEIVKIAKKLNGCFDKFADEEEKDSIFGEGMFNLFTAMGIDPEGSNSVAVAWRLKCGECGEISREEFTRGFAKLGCNSEKSVKAKCGEIKASMADNDNYKKMYRWCFELLKEDKERKTLDCEPAFGMWEVLLKPKFHYYEKWMTFLKEEHKPRAVTNDMWVMVLAFAVTVGKNVDGFEDDGSWPSVIDDFVEYLQDHP